MVFHRSSSDSKSPQVSRTLLSILADLNNAVVCGLSSLVLLFPSPSVPLSILWWLVRSARTNYDWYHRHFHIPLFFQFSSKVLIFIVLFTFFQFYPVISLNGKVHYSIGFFFYSQGLVFWPGLDDPFVSQNPREVCASRSPGRILVCAYTICSHGQISMSCTVPVGSPSSPSCV